MVEDALYRECIKFIHTFSVKYVKEVEFAFVDVVEKKITKDLKSTKKLCCLLDGQTTVHTMSEFMLYV